MTLLDVLRYFPDILEDIIEQRGYAWVESRPLDYYIGSDTPIANAVDFALRNPQMFDVPPPRCPLIFDDTEVDEPEKHVRLLKIYEETYASLQ
jgi:hypothetical protein